MAAKEKPLPKTLAGCADELFTTRRDRLKIQKQVDKLQERETQLKDHIIDKLPKSEASGIAGKVARAQIEKKLIPRVEDWDKFYSFVKKNGAFELMQRRINEAAVKERAEAGKPVPGIGSFTALIVSCTALKGRK